MKNKQICRLESSGQTSIICKKITKEIPDMDIIDGGPNQLFNNLVNRKSYLWSGVAKKLIILITPEILGKFSKPFIDNEIPSLPESIDLLFNSLKDFLIIKYKTEVLINSLPPLRSHFINNSDENSQKNYITSLFNIRLSELVFKHKNISMISLDFSSFKFNYCERPEFEFLYNLEYSMETHLEIADKFVSQIKLIESKIKVIALDLDNTLWKGIAEQGESNIQINSLGESAPYWYFQEILLAAKNMGFLLVLVSKNNEKEIREIWKKKIMPLNLNDFISIKINWERKSKNILEISEELNLGLDSFLFVDDSPNEILEVKQTLPDINTFTVPKDNSNFVSEFLNKGYLNKLNISEEDNKRFVSYENIKERKKLEVSSESFNDYLKSLKTEVFIEKLKVAEIDRIYSLFIRSNQFNLTGWKPLKDNFEEYLSMENYSSFTIKIKDKFEDYGIVGFFVINRINKKNFIEQFCLSCRVIGRGIESAIIHKLFSFDKCIEFKFLNSSKNHLFENSLNSLGYKIKIENEGLIFYKIKSNIVPNKFIRVNFNDRI